MADKNKKGKGVNDATSYNPLSNFILGADEVSSTPFGQPHFDPHTPEPETPTDQKTVDVAKNSNISYSNAQGLIQTSGDIANAGLSTMRNATEDNHIANSIASQHPLANDPDFGPFIKQQALQQVQSMRQSAPDIPKEYSDMRANTQLLGLDKDALYGASRPTTTAPTSDAIDRFFGGKNGMDTSHIIGKDGNVTPQYFQQVYQLAGGQPAKFKEASDALMTGNLDEYFAKGSNWQQYQQSLSNALHDNPVTDFVGKVPVIGGALKDVARAPYYAEQAAMGTARGVTNTANFGAAGLTFASPQEYARMAKSGETAFGATPAAGEQDANALDKALSMGSRMLGEFANVRVGGAGYLNKLEGNLGAKVLAGTETMANASLYNKTINALYAATSKINGTYAGRLIENSLHNTVSATPIMFAGYYDDALKRGYGEDQAGTIALNHTLLSNVVMSVATSFVGGPAMKKQIRELFTAASEDAPKTFAGKLGEFSKKVLPLVKQSTAGGAAFGLGGIADQAMNRHEDAAAGKEVQPFNWDEVKDAVASGFLFDLVKGAVGGHGILPSRPQAEAVHAMIADPERANRALDAAVKRGEVTPEQATAARGFIERIKPSVAEGLQKGMEPAMAVKVGIEKARLQETADEMVRLSGENGLPKGVSLDAETGKAIAIDPKTGLPSEDHAKVLIKTLDDLKARAAASTDALNKLEKGTNLRGRTVAGDEMAKLSSKYTPDNALSISQAKAIAEGGPYHVERVPVADIAADDVTISHAQEHMGRAEVKEYQELQKEKKDITDKEESKDRLTEINTRLKELSEKMDSNVEKTKAEQVKKLGLKENEHGMPIVLDKDGNVIDGKKRLAYAILSGAKDIEVARPVDGKAMGKQMQESYDSHIPTEAKNDIETFAKRVMNGEQMSTPEDLQFYANHAADIEQAIKQRPHEEAEQMAQYQYQSHLAEPTEAEKEQGITTPAQRGLIAATQHLVDEGLSKGEVFDSLQHITDGAHPMPELEAAYNHVKNEPIVLDRPVEPLAQNVPHETLEPQSAATTGRVNYTTSNGRYTVSYENGGLRVFNKGTGKEVKGRWANYAIREAAENYDFTNGVSGSVQSTDASTPEEWGQHILSQSTRPAEIVAAWQLQEPEGHNLTHEEEIIAGFASNISPESFYEHGDRNAVKDNPKMGMTYLRNNGKSIDVLADAASEAAGKEITPQDFIDFMYRFPNGAHEAGKTWESGVANDLAAKFESLTGFPLSKEIAEIALAQEEKGLSEAEKQILDHEYQRYEDEQRAFDQAIADGRIDTSAENIIPDVRQSESQGQAPATAEQPAGDGQHAKERALTQPIRSVGINILASNAAMKDAGWNRQSMQAIHNRMTKLFGDEVGFVAVDDSSEGQFRKAEAVESIGKSKPLGWYDPTNHTVYINVQRAKPSTVVHEFGHLWFDWAKSNAPSLHAHGLAIAKNTEIYKYWEQKSRGEVPDNAGKLSAADRKLWDSYAEKYKGNGDKIAEEIVMQTLQEEMKNLQPNEKAGFSKWLSELYKRLKTAFGFSRLTEKEFYNLGIKEFSKKIGEELNSESPLTRKIKEWTPEERDAHFVGIEAAKSRLKNIEDNERKQIEADERKASGKGGGVDNYFEGTEDAMQPNASPSSVTAPEAATNISGGDILTHLENAHPELASKLYDAVRQTEAYKAQEGTNDDQRAAVVLENMLDNVNGISAADKKVMGGFSKRRGSLHLEGLMGEAFKTVGEAAKKATGQDIDVRALAQTLAERAASKVESNNNVGHRVEGKDIATTNLNRISQAIADINKSVQAGTIPDTKAARLIRKLNEVADFLKASPEDAVAYRVIGKGAETEVLHVSDIAKRKREGTLSNEDAKTIYNDEAMYSLGKELTDKQKAYIEKLSKERGKDDEELQGFITHLTGASKAEAKDMLNEVLGRHLPKVHPVTGEPFETSLMREVTNNELKGHGLEEIPETERKSLVDGWNNAAAQLQADAGAADRVYEELRKNAKKSLNDDEVHLLLHKKIELETSIKTLSKLSNEAHAANNSTAFIAHDVALDAAYKRLQDFNTVTAGAATNTARGLRALQVMAREDYSLASVLARASARVGKPLNEMQQKTVEQRVSEIEKKQADLTKVQKEQEQQRTERASKEAAKSKIERDFKTARKTGGSNKESILKRARAMFKADERMYSLPETDLEGNNAKPAIRAIVKELYRDYIANGERDAEVITSKVTADLKDIFPDATEREIRDVYSGYGEMKELSGEKLDVAERELREEGRLLSAIEDALGGEQPLKSGLQRGESSDKARELRQQLNDLMKKNKIEAGGSADKLKGALDRVKKSLENQIKDIDEQIDNGRRTREAGGIEYDDAAKDLQRQRDERRKVLDEMWPKEKSELTDEQRLSIATKAIERSIKELQRRIAENDLTTREKLLGTAESDKLKALKAEREGLKNILKEKQDAAGITTDIAMKRLRASYERRTAKLEERRRLQQFEIPEKTKQPYSQKVRDAQAAYNQAKRALDKDIEEWRASNRTRMEKFFAGARSWGKGVKLLGLSIYPKLLAADVSNMLFNMVDAAGGHGIAKILGRVGIKAYGEGAVHISQEAKSFVRGAMAGITEAKAIWKGEGSYVDNVSDKRHFYATKGLAHYMGATHEILKNPLKRGRFEAYAEKMTQNMLDAGLNPNDDLNHMTIIGESVQAAERAVYAQKSRLASWISQQIRRLETPDKRTGRVGAAKLIAGLVVDSEIPFLKVPINIAGGTLGRIGGIDLFRGLSKLHGEYAALKRKYPDLVTFHERWEKMADEMPVQQADQIVRLMKRGFTGLALTALGVLYYNSYGGKYLKGKDEVEGLKEDETNFLGLKLPRILGESDPMQTMQWAATARQLYGQMVEKDHMSGWDAAELTGVDLVLGFTTKVPFFSEGQRIGEIWNSNSHGESKLDKWKEFGGKMLAGDVVPQLSNEVAQQMDKDAEGNKIKRKPTPPSKGGTGNYLKEEFESRIPGLRENVPEK